ncbi:FabD/lysophospholipase-like protein [Hypoxylon sp. FL1284]|nr:FabD/lysophospholipase-like protein [Hypoxylon sp. FL1284]
MASTVKILSLDGGGIRGLSSLLILQKIMETIQKDQHLEQVPRPCDYFDLIGGTSTGGIIAIMLGRLGMTVEDCIEAYRNLAERAFTPKRRLLSVPVSPKGAYSALELERAMKEVVKNQCKDEKCFDSQTCSHGNEPFCNDSCVKTVVLAITKENVDAKPTLFRTYDKTSGFRDCTIWQVARATSAASTFFKSIKLGRDMIEFIDAGFGYNNPCEVLMEEAFKQFPGACQARILSIGTGLGSIVTIRNARISILRALKSISTTSKKVADRLDEEYGGTGWYYRFNVDRGLEDVTLADWHKNSQISAHTHNYLQDKEREIMRCAAAFSGALDDDVDDYDDELRYNPRFHMLNEKARRLLKANESRVIMLGNIVSRDSEQYNSITRYGGGEFAKICGNECDGGSRQWNLVAI